MNRITEFTRNCPTCGKPKYYVSEYYKNLAEKNKSVCSPCGAKNQKNNKFRDGGCDRSYTKTDEYRKKCARTGSQNAFSRGLKNLWVNKYGEEKAEKMWIERSKKLSIASSGKNNPMYGISPSMKAGRGLSCKYKGIYFRSLLELSYFIQIIERYQIPYVSAETGKLRIKYVFEEKEKTYVADFLLDNKYLIEIKP